MTEFSPLLAQRRGLLEEGPETGRVPAGEPTGPAGWSQEPDGRGRTQTHPLQPLQGFRGPLRWSGCLQVSVLVLAGYSPVLPTRLYPPGTIPIPRTDADTVPTTGSTVTAGMYIWQFWDPGRRT